MLINSEQKNKVRNLKLIHAPEFMVLIALLAVFIFFLIMSPKNFLSLKNIGSFMSASAQLGVVAIGAGIMAISGEFDISVGSNYAITGIIIGLLSKSLGLPTLLSIFIGLIFSTSIGFLNGLITIHFRIPSFIVTLGTWLFWYGFALALSKGFFISIKPNDNIIAVFCSHLGEQFYTSIFWWIFIGIIMIIIVNRTALGNWIFAVGGNSEAARAVGVPHKRVKLFAFSLYGFLAGISAIFTLGQMGSMNALYGQNLSMNAIAAAVIGGCSLSGGSGSVLGAMLGAILMSMINSGLILAGAPTFWYQTFVGLIIVIAVIINNAMSNRVAHMR